MSRRMRGIGAVVLGLAVAASGLLIYVDEQHTYDVKTENFRFESGGNELAATLTLPTNGDALGVIVFIHGDGPADAANHDIGYRPMWEAIADAGWASVSWDKPGVGGSSGNWLAQTMEDRATEGVDVVASLADHPGIDANRVGLIGFSQAGWVLPLVANTVPVEFVIAGSLAINWLDQGRYLTNSQLSDNNASEDIRHSVNEANQTGLSVLEPDATYEEYLEWHEQLDPTIVPYLGEMSAKRWQFVANNYRADATDGLASMVDTPVLLLLAGQDAQRGMPPSRDLSRSATLADRRQRHWADARWNFRSPEHLRRRAPLRHQHLRHGAQRLLSPPDSWPTPGRATFGRLVSSRNAVSCVTIPPTDLATGHRVSLNSCPTVIARVALHQELNSNDT
jgi:uncharacterized protein